MLQKCNYAKRILQNGCYPTWLAAFGREIGGVGVILEYNTSTAATTPVRQQESTHFWLKFFFSCVKTKAKHFFYIRTYANRVWRRNPLQDDTEPQHESSASHHMKLHVLSTRK